MRLVSKPTSWRTSASNTGHQDASNALAPSATGSMRRRNSWHNAKGELLHGHSKAAGPPEPTAPRDRNKSPSLGRMMLVSDIKAYARRKCAQAAILWLCALADLFR